MHERGMPVELADGRQMLASPIPAIIDLDLDNRLSTAPVVENWNRQPDRAFRSLHAVAIAPTVLVELHVVIVHENVGFAQEIEISEPGQITRLQDDEGFHETPLRRDRELLRGDHAALFFRVGDKTTMCGIAGFTGPHNRTALQSMTECLRHRGPDAVGYWEGAGVSLGM